MCDQIRELCKGWDSHLQVKNIFMFVELGKTVVLKEKRSGASVGSSIKE